MVAGVCGAFSTVRLGIWVSGETDVPIDDGDVASYITIENNIVFDTVHIGIRVYHADMVKVTNNIVHNCGYNGIDLHSTHKAHVFGNTVSKTCQVGSTASILLSDHDTGTCYLCIDNVVMNNHIIEIDTTKPTYAIAESAGVNIYDNIFRQNITEGYEWNIHNTEKSGTGTLVSGTTSIAIHHGLRSTPVAGDIVVTPIETWGSMTKFWIGNYTSTTFTIYADTNPMQDVDFAWTAAIYG